MGGGGDARALGRGGKAERPFCEVWISDTSQTGTLPSAPVQSFLGCNPRRRDQPNPYHNPHFLGKKLRTQSVLDAACLKNRHPAPPPPCIRTLASGVRRAELRGTELLLPPREENPGQARASVLAALRAASVRLSRPPWGESEASRCKAPSDAHAQQGRESDTPTSDVIPVLTAAGRVSWASGKAEPLPF